MNSKAKLFCLCCTGALVSSPSFSEVTSLSSSELTETFIKDSTIIVTPKQKAPKPQQTKTYSSLTIAPVENNDQDFDQLEHSKLHQDNAATSFALDEEALRNAGAISALNPLDPVDIETYHERTTIPVADILNDERYRVPEGDFDFSYIGGAGNSELGLSRVGDQVTFSIGNPPGIPNPIEIPEAIQEGPMTLIPRPNGGFDLTIDVPQN